MNKSKKIILFSILSLMVLAGCDKPNLSTINLSTEPIPEGTIRHPEGRSEDGYIDEIGWRFKTIQWDNEFKTVEKHKKEALDLLKAGTDYNKFYEKLLTIFNDDAEHVVTQYFVKYVYYNTDTTNKNYENRYLEAYDYYNGLYEWLSEVEIKIADSSFRSHYYEGMTNAEIDAYVGSLSGAGELSTLEKRNLELELEYQNLDTTSSDFMPRVNEIYYELVQNNKRIAVLNGYDNYMDYAYAEIYERDYTPEQSQTFSNLIQKYDFTDIVVNGNGNDPTYPEGSAMYNYYTALNYSHYLDPNANCEELLNNYAKKMGPTFEEAYTKLFNEGYYVFAGDAEKAAPGAFQANLYEYDNPFVYYGPGYQSITTVVHELGHYYASYANPINSNRSFDICETHSQANEALFLNYLKSENTNAQLRSPISSTIRCANYNSAILMWACAIVNDFELYVYSHDDYTKDDFDDIYEKVCANYGGYYAYKWYQVCITNPAYYISYAVSLVPSVEFNILASENLNNAITKYVNMVAYDEEDDAFLTILNSCGLSNPFEDATFDKLEEYLRGQLFASNL